MNGFIALTAFQLVWGSGGGGGGAKTWTADLMAEPLGQVVVGVLGAAIVIVGVIQLKTAYDKSFLEQLDTARMDSRMRTVTERMGQIGHAARGVVFPIIGIALLTAAIQHDASEAKGLGEALHTIASNPYGQVLLILVAAGFLAYGAYMIATAKYKRIRIQAPSGG